MNEKPNGFAGVAAALAALRVQIAALVRTGVEEATRRMDMVKREEFDALAARVAELEVLQPAAAANPSMSPDKAAEIERDKFDAG